MEKNLLSFFFSGREIKSYQVLYSGKVVIIPYDVVKSQASLIPETELKRRYPHTYAYLRENKVHLEDRERGRMRGGNWYAYGRLQNIEVMKIPKLLVPDIADCAAFASDELGKYAFTSGYGITLKKSTSLAFLYLLGLLNSNILDFYWKHISTPLRGGFFRYFTQYLEQLPIRTIDFTNPADKAKHDLIVTIVDYIIYLKNQLDADVDHARDYVMVKYFEQIIDGLVYELYLTDELHRADKYFFNPLLDENLPQLQDINGNKTSALRDIFERLFDKKHPVRKALFFLNSLETIRIIEGKA